VVAYEDVERFIRDEIAATTAMPPESISSDTVLVGTGRVIDSADLVMLLLSVEEFARDRLGAAFDWTSDSAMSEARSVLRSVGSLARHVTDLQSADSPHL
jgi:acyl carrier protein